MTALAAIFLRDMRLSVRLGGGALVGVLFFLIVVTLMPFAIGPTWRCSRALGRRSSGSAHCWRACSRSTG